MRSDRWALGTEPMRAVEALVGEGPVPTLVADSLGRVVHATRAWQGTYGLDAEALVGRPVADLFVPQDRPRVLEAISRLTSEVRLAHRGLRLVDADGVARETELRWRRWRAQATQLLVLHAVDTSAAITMARQVEELHERLAEARERGADPRDPETGLPGPQLADELLTHLVARARRDGRSVVVLRVDIGAQRSGGRSSAAASALQGASRAGDVLARLDRTELAAAAELPNGRRDGMAWAQRLLEGISRAIDVEVDDLPAGLAIGDATLDAPTLLAAAAGQLELGRHQPDRRFHQRVLTGRQEQADVIHLEPGTGYEVLVVDDDASVLDLLGVVCRLAGFEVLTAPDVPTARSLLRDRLPDAVVLDVLLPGTDGRALLAEIRADERTQHLPVVVCSALTSDREQWESWATGASAVFGKPFEPDDVVDELVRLCAHDTREAPDRQSDGRIAVDRLPTP